MNWFTMFKRLTAWLLLACVLCILPAPPARADEENVLVLADVEGDADAEASLAFLRSLMTYTNAQVTYADAWSDMRDLAAYTSVIVLVEEGRALSETTAQAIRRSGVKTMVIGPGALAQLAPARWVEGSVVVRLTDADAGGDILIPGSGVTLLEGEGESLGGHVYVGGENHPLCKTVGQLTHWAWFDAGNEAMCAALATAIQAWQWPYDNLPTAYGSYLVLDRVYPFYEPARLMELTDMLEKEGVPFAVSLMPVYDNAEYPAMKRFCEYLRYLQSRGVGMILHMPQVTLTQVDTADMVRHLEIAYEAYSMYGVYPTALQAGEHYLLCEKGIELLRGFRTIFLERSEETIDTPPLSTNAARRDGHQIITAAWDDMNAFTSSFAQAIYLDVNEDVDVLQEYVRRIKASRRALKSLPQMENTLYLGEYYVVQNAQGITVNGEKADLTYTPFTYDEDYKFDRGFAQYLTEQIETSNKLILIFVLVACTLFITFTLMSRRVMRRELVTGLNKQRQSAKKAARNEAAQEVDQQ